MTDEEETVRLLRIIRDLAILKYPFTGTPVDAGLCFALGEIAGIAMRALTNYQDKDDDITPSASVQPLQ